MKTCFLLLIFTFLLRSITLADTTCVKQSGVGDSPIIRPVLANQIGTTHFIIHWESPTTQSYAQNAANYAEYAYEKQVPVTEDIFCDFYLLQSKVYIEYWGLTDKKDYVKRKENKKRIYEKYKLNLVELSEQHLHDLDAYFPKLLLKFNVKMI